MEILNPGNILPVYENLESQMANRCGCKEFDWAIPVAQGEMLSVQIPVPSGGFGAWDWAYYKEGEITANALDASLLLYSETSEGEAWISYHGDGSIIPGRDCGVFWFEFFSTGGLRYYSERFMVIEFNDKEKIYKLTFTHSTDIDGMLYQGGYTQKVWLLDAVFDTPDIREATENATDGNAVEVLTFQSIQRREVLRFPYFPDFWQGVFHRLRMYDNVTLTKLETGEVFTLSGQGVEFATEEQDVCFSQGALSWRCFVQVMTGCEEDNLMTYLNNVLIL